MSKVFSMFFAALVKALAWFSVMENRRKVYLFLMAMGPVLFLTGRVTPDQWQLWMDALSGLLLFGGAGLAARNSKES